MQQDLLINRKENTTIGDMKVLFKDDRDKTSFLKWQEPILPSAYTEGKNGQPKTLQDRLTAAKTK